MIEQLIARPSRAVALMAVAAMLAVAAALGATETRAAQPIAGEFVGTVPGTDAFIGVSTDGRSFVAYICDGKPEGVSLYRWFTGEVVAGRVQLQDLGGLAIAFNLGGNQINGQVAIGNGQVANFSAATAFGEAGLFRATIRTEEAGFTGGWIVLNDASDDRANASRDDRTSNVSVGLDFRGAVLRRPVDNPTDVQFQGVGDFDPVAGTAVINGQTVTARRVTPTDLGDDY